MCSCPALAAASSQNSYVRSNGWLRSADPSVAALQATRAAAAAVLEDGFAVLHNTVQWQAPLAALRAAIERLQDAGWHPAFVFMYDEAWALMHNVQKVMHDGALATW